MYLVLLVSLICCNKFIVIWTTQIEIYFYLEYQNSLHHYPSGAGKNVETKSVALLVSTVLAMTDATGHHTGNQTS